MLTYVQEVLTKVSFSKVLFEKELYKALKQLGTDEIVQLRSWCYANFANLYTNEIEQLFNSFL